MEHNEDKHYENVNLLCRVCGRSSHTTMNKKHTRNPCLVQKVLKELEFICGYSLAAGESISKYVCTKCVSSIKGCVKRSSTTTKERIIQFLKSSDHLWVAFNPETREEDCAACKRKNDLKKGCIPDAKKN